MADLRARLPLDRVPRGRSPASWRRCSCRSAWPGPASWPGGRRSPSGRWRRRSPHGPPLRRPVRGVVGGHAVPVRHDRRRGGRRAGARRRRRRPVDVVDRPDVAGRRHARRAHLRVPRRGVPHRRGGVAATTTALVERCRRRALLVGRRSPGVAALVGGPAPPRRRARRCSTGSPARALPAGRAVRGGRGGRAVGLVAAPVERARSPRSWPWRRWCWAGGSGSGRGCSSTTWRSRRRPGPRRRCGRCVVTFGLAAVPVVPVARATCSGSPSATSPSRGE